jgi:N4-(beta-N-acetylglucosaminyl)-L-asparaginase
MFNRRNFLTHTGWLGLAGSLGLVACDAEKKQPQNTKKSKVNANSQTGSPMVIATWGPNRKATAEAMRVLKAGKTALDAVEAGARIPEADPEDTSVGYGGLPDREGIVTLDACIMDEKGNAGSVTFLRDIMHPISVARLVMEKTPHVILSGAGALDFALANGFKRENLLTDKAKQAWEEWKKESKYQPKINVERHDTIGILAIDPKNNLSGACTTSGLAYKMHGRVGDSPIIGAGLYVDNEVGGACATGLGEMVIKTVGSFLAVELMRQGATPQEACEEVIKRICARNQNYRDFQVGVLAINKKGEHGAYSIQKGFNYALYQGDKNQVFEAEYFMQSNE